MTRKTKRLYGILFLLLGVGVATALTLTALKENISYFRTPTEIVTGQYPERATDRGFRIGGMVVKGSLRHDGKTITFRVTDFTNSLPVKYQGIAPDLFGEGKGVVADGKMNADGVFVAERILAKHDEKYMPPEIKKTMQHAASTKP